MGETQDDRLQVQVQRDMTVQGTQTSQQSSATHLQYVNGPDLKLLHQTQSSQDRGSSNQMVGRNYGVVLHTGSSNQVMSPGSQRPPIVSPTTMSTVQNENNKKMKSVTPLMILQETLDGRFEIKKHYSDLAIEVHPNQTHSTQMTQFSNQAFSPNET